MLIIDANGDYAYDAGTQTLSTSEHPVYQARIEVALMIDSWLFAPTAQQNLARFKNTRQTPANVDEFKKELLYGLDKYGPDATDPLVEDGGVSYGLKISQDALNATVSNS